MIQNYFNKFNNCFFIAEIGVNHNGDLTLAKEMIDAAIKSGADAVKFQTFKAELLVKRYSKSEISKRTTESNESHFDMIKNLELSHEDHFILKDYCEKNNILFLSTPYDVESANFLHKCLDIEIFKTASADLIDQPLHEYIANTGKPSIISVGMATLGEIEETLRIYQKYQNLDVILLHCVSNYPCSHESLNLRVMNTLKSVQPSCWVF